MSSVEPPLADVGPFDAPPRARTRRRPLGAAVVGFGWMGRMHAQVPHHFLRLDLCPEPVTVADEVPGRAEEAAGRFGFATGLYTDQIAHALHGTDIAMLIGLPVAVGVYLAACRSLDTSAERARIAEADRGLEPDTKAATTPV